jgi:succinoglycan biosynthesis protein ExoA
MPVLNEEAYIAASLSALLPQAEAMDADVVVMDGGSTDATRAIVQGLQLQHTRLSWLANPRRLQAAALNLAAATLPPDITVIIRADAHAGYPADFVRRCVTALREWQATSVVVPMRTLGRSPVQRAIALVQNSRLGNGGAAHRTGARSGFVDHGHHAAFDRAFFRSIGGYDESFSHNEDAELDERARRAGGRIWMCADACIDYFPRSHIWPLARQYFRHGAGRARTLRKHRLRPRPRQLAAPAILLGCAGGIVLAPISPWTLLAPLAYAAGCAGWAMIETILRRDMALLAVAPAAMATHLGWGAGFLSTLAASLRPRSPRGIGPAVPTR